MSPGCRIAALSGPRGLGKTTLVADLARRFLTPGDPLHRPGGVAHVIAAGMAQAQRTTFRQLRGMIGDDPDYKITENVNLAYVAHRASGTAVSVLAANGKTAQGLVDVDMVFADEPGAWEINGGQLVADALETALGKPGSRMRIIYIGTLAPKATGPGHWYYDLIAGGSDTVTGVHVTAFRGDPKRWDEASEIRRVNPLMWKYPESRKQLLRERDRARNDSRLRARFLSYRLNLPSADESEMLLSVTDWELCLLRPVPDPDGRPTVGIDLGEDRAWSAAVAVWPNGRVEAFACCPGIPGIDDQERRDMVPAGTYRRLVDAGCLIPSDGLRVPPVRMVTDEVAYRWVPPNKGTKRDMGLVTLSSAGRGLTGLWPSRNRHRSRGLVSGGHLRACRQVWGPRQRRRGVCHAHARERRGRNRPKRGLRPRFGSG